MGINAFVDDLDELQRIIFYENIYFSNNHHSVIKMLTRAFAAYSKVLRKYVGIYDKYDHAFEDCLLVLDLLPNACLEHQIFDPVTMYGKLKVISYDRQKMSLNYELVFSAYIESL